jgi:hypothetical protein
MTDTTSTPIVDPAAEQAAVAPQPTVPENPYAVPAAAAPATTASNGFSVSSLVLGIVSIPTGLAVAGIVAIVLGFIARNREPQGRTMANWGIALGFVGLFGWLIFAIIGFAFFAPFALWGAGWGGGFDFLDVF